MRRNRRRIAFLAVAGFMNYWIAALLFVIALIVGTIGAFLIQGFVEGGDFSLMFALLKGVPKAIEWAVSAG